jgi:ATP-dependent Lon protease
MYCLLKRGGLEPYSFRLNFDVNEYGRYFCMGKSDLRLIVAVVKASSHKEREAWSQWAVNVFKNSIETEYYKSNDPLYSRAFILHQNEKPPILTKEQLRKAIDFSKPAFVKSFNQPVQIPSTSHAQESSTAIQQEDDEVDELFDEVDTPSKQSGNEDQSLKRKRDLEDRCDTTQAIISLGKVIESLEKKHTFELAQKLQQQREDLTTRHEAQLAVKVMKKELELRKEMHAKEIEWCKEMQAKDKALRDEFQRKTTELSEQIALKAAKSAEVVEAKVKERLEAKEEDLSKKIKAFFLSL